MTLKQIEAFYWAAKLGTFAIAANRLHVTQSSLSKRIVELETDLGHALFDRNGRRTTLTAAGEILLEKAGSMLEFERDIRSSLAQRVSEVRGQCAFGITELAATTWFPALASRLEHEHPAIKLEPQVGLSRTLEKAVIRGELDVATIAGLPMDSTLRSHLIAEIEFVWTASPSRLQPNSVLTPQLLATLPVIGNSQESGLTSLLQAWLASNELHAGRMIACNSRAAIISLTVAGVGISFQPRTYVQPLIQRGLLLALDSEPALPLLPYHLIWRRDDERKLIGAVCELVRQEADFSADNLFWSPS
jgi:DNA-binding transcriptional LysR family regulator